MFLIILSLLLNQPVIPMPSEVVTIGGVVGKRPVVSANAVNWWQQSAQPGQGSNVVLYGHSPGVFTDLHRIRPGAVVTVISGGRAYSYIVTRAFVVEETAGHWIDATAEERLTLITCAGETDNLIVIGVPR